MGRNQRERKNRRVEQEKQLKEEIKNRRREYSFWSKFWVRPVFWIYAVSVLAIIAYPFYGRQLVIMEAKKHDEAIIHTNMGDIAVKLYNFDAPETTNNFVRLAQRGYYDGVTFHRVIKDFMIQGGDPSGDGTGGESADGGLLDDEINADYLGLADKTVAESSFLGSVYGEEELQSLSGDMTLKAFYESKGYVYNNQLKSHKMVHGSIAMANRGPNTNGSQFFIVTGEEQLHLDGKHTVFGEVVSGMDVAIKISEVEADSESSKPVSPVTITSIEIK